MRMIVNIEDVLNAFKVRRRINHESLKDIAWHYNGQEMSIPEVLIEEWAFTGMNNVDFVDYVIRECLPKEEVTLRQICTGIVCTRVSALDDILEVLMQLKCKFRQWEFPGGKLDGLETAPECAKRELAEETGLTANQLYQIHYFDLRRFGCVMFHAPLHLMAETTPKLMEPNKHSALGWFPLDNLPTPMTLFNNASIKAGILESVRRYYGGVYATKR